MKSVTLLEVPRLLPFTWWYADSTDLLTVADLADAGFVEDADRFSMFLRQRDGLGGRVTVVRHE